MKLCVLWRGWWALVWLEYCGIENTETAAAVESPVRAAQPGNIQFMCFALGAGEKHKRSIRAARAPRSRVELGVLHFLVFICFSGGWFGSSSNQQGASAHPVSLFCGQWVHELPLFHGPHPHAGERPPLFSGSTLLEGTPLPSPDGLPGRLVCFLAPTHYGGPASTYGWCRSRYTRSHTHMLSVGEEPPLFSGSAVSLGAARPRQNHGIPWFARDGHGIRCVRL